MMMLRLQYFYGRRIIGGQQWQRAQIAEEVGQPEAADRDWHDYVGHSYVESLRKIRLDNPEQVHITHQQHPCGQPDQLADVALERARQQHREWNGEVEDHDEQADVAPAAV